MTPDERRRCAIYTRKSSDEGLEQSFNSLHAQREACSAYIRSQEGEGWRTLAARYDDGGYSGASLDRPALRRLLSDISMGRVDIVVVYKVDRLTRSLADFARIIEAFDKANVAFVSITQAFNTTSSMGRLTLNVLLSFAQFEREITGERIRDKLAASKAKGMWMGGVPPLGYDPPADAGRALVVNAAEAETVRFIFQRFLSAGNTYALQQALDDEGVRSKRWTTVAGRRAGGSRFSRGALRHLLSNRIYVGEIVHKGQAHRGRHRPILDVQAFEAAQKVLEAGRQKKRNHVPRRASALLDRILFDADGQRMELVSVARRRGMSYSYYVSPSCPGSADSDIIRRVPASATETFLRGRVANLMQVAEADRDPTEFRATVSRVEVHTSTVEVLLRRRTLLGGSTITLEGLRRRLLPGEQLRQEANDPRLIRVTLPIRLKLRGGRCWSVAADGQAQPVPSRPDEDLIKRIQTAHAIARGCGADLGAPLGRFRYARAPSQAGEVAKAQWAFLAPDLQRRIFAGERPAAHTWLRKGPLPLAWSAQRALFEGRSGQTEAQETMH